MDALVIIGIDPGTHCAFAVLDLDGKILKINSARNYGINNMTKDILQEGKAFLLGSDVAPSPVTTKKIARRIGAEIIEPEQSLRVQEKIKMVDEYLKKQTSYIKIQNKHEHDALAAAVYAWKKIRMRLIKIEENCRQQKKEYLIQKIREKVLLEKIPITKAIKLCS
ncbi:DUF460 domain-containing protein [Candidatus Woesearchaeota archaeon]|nr:DUF460 domain-containing protein [Candidatus Woesearchaeota archaeon]